MSNATITFIFKLYIVSISELSLSTAIFLLTFSLLRQPIVIYDRFLQMFPFTTGIKNTHKRTRIHISEMHLNCF